MGLVALSAIGAELLAAYDDSTGQVGALLFALVFFGALYGAPALLIREVARRAGWRWPSMLMIALALGIVQAGVIDQSLFSVDYRDIDGWEESLRDTFIAPLGFSAYNAYSFVLGHVIYSFGAPIAVAEAWRPAHGQAPWLQGRGIAMAAVAYLGAAALIMADPDSTAATATQVAASLVVSAICLAAAVWVGQRPSRVRTESVPPGLGTTVLGTLALAVVAGAVPETWIGFAIAIAAMSSAGILLARMATRSGWNQRHVAAVGVGFLLTRGLLAFLYFPLVGEVSAKRKYAHNVLTLVVVGVAGWLALRAENHDMERIDRHDSTERQT